MNITKDRIIQLLDEGNYQYFLKDSVLNFYDNRIGDIFDYCWNKDLCQAIRNEQSIIKLDLSNLKVVPTKIEGFRFLEEIVMPKLTNKIPQIINCPNLYHVEFNASTITHLEEKSFTGWPHIPLIKFSEALCRISSFGFAGSVDIIDLSECCMIRIDEHAFHNNHYIKKIILPVRG